MKVIYTPDIKDDLSTQMPSDEEQEYTPDIKDDLIVIMYIRGEACDGRYECPASCYKQGDIVVTDG